MAWRHQQGGWARKGHPMMAKFAAFAVDINGTALARYDLTATDAETAAQEARQYLTQHPLIEVWSDDHRRVARLVRR